MTVATILSLITTLGSLAGRLITENREATAEEWQAVLDSVAKHRAEAKSLDTLG